MIYLIVQTTWNGVTPLHSDYSAYKTEELAYAVVKKLKSLNQDNVSYRIVPMDYYDSETEVPILNELQANK